MSNTTPLGKGRTSSVRVDGYQLGLARTGNHHGLSAVAYGSQIPIGRLVVFSPAYIQAINAGVDNPQRSVMLPTDGGADLINPADGTPLSGNAALVSDSKLDGAYLVAGIVFEADRCDDGFCDQPSPWPIGEPDNLRELEYGQHRRPLTFGTEGYFSVPIGEDIKVGDKLAFSDTVDDRDPNVGVQSYGYIMKAGNGVQDLPEDWQVVRGGKAGTSAEIFIKRGALAPAAP